MSLSENDSDARSLTTARGLDGERRECTMAFHRADNARVVESEVMHATEPQGIDRVTLFGPDLRPGWLAMTMHQGTRHPGHVVHRPNSHGD
jgi:hypothetical protein